MVKLKLSALPKGLSMLQVYVISWLCGIGFTMPVLITNLAFTDPQKLTGLKSGYSYHLFLQDFLAGSF